MKAEREGEGGPKSKENERSEEGLVKKRGGRREPDTKSLQMPCLRDLCFRLCVEGDAQKISNAIFNGDHLDAFWDRQFDAQHLREVMACGSCVMFRFVLHGEDHPVEPPAADLETVVSAC